MVDLIRHIFDTCLTYILKFINYIHSNNLWWVVVIVIVGGFLLQFFEAFTKMIEINNAEKENGLQGKANNISTNQRSEDNNNKQTTDCPYCKETIVVGALKCKHCMSSLDVSP